MHPDETLLLGFFYPAQQQYGRYLLLPNGLKPAPAINDRGVKELWRLLRYDQGICVTDFVDDMIGGSPTSSEAWGDLSRAVDFFLQAGVPISDKPTGIRAPSQRQTWVGWVFDTVGNTLSVEPKK